MSKQSSDMGEDEVKKQKTSARKRRRGPWELWVTFKSWNSYREPWSFMARDYATKDLAEVSAEKHKRDGCYDKIEVIYNKKKDVNG